jgi:DNA polymerase-4
VGDEGRTFLHLDMDAFFVEVELLDRPDLRGRPVIVGGSSDRGVVAAASYEARAFGIRSAMPSSRARRLCPDAVFLAGRHRRYAEASADLMDVLRSFTPFVEPLSLDEAFLDVTGALRRPGSSSALATEIRDAVRERTLLPSSVGVAPVKFVAKLASELAKPRATPSGPAPGAGVVVVGTDEVDAFLRPLDVAALWGVGPATLARLRAMGIATVGDLADTDPAALVASVGEASGRHLHALANGVDPRGVEPDRQAKSIGHEVTHLRDLDDDAALDRELVRLADAVSARLRRHGTAGRTVTLKVRFSDFRTVTRSTTLDRPISGSTEVLRAARSLLAALDRPLAVRLLGLSMGRLGDTGAQMSFDDLADDPWVDLDRATDEIRERFGTAALRRASTLDRSGGALGEDRWGPGGLPAND